MNTHKRTHNAAAWAGGAKRLGIALLLALGGLGAPPAQARDHAAQAAQQPGPAMIDLERAHGVVDGPEFYVDEDPDGAATDLTLPLPDGFPVPVVAPPAGGLEYGDAPDSTGPNMSAYPGVPARFPTLRAARGPHHAQPDNVYLGDAVTRDRLVDEDGLPNLMPAANTPNLDAMDDGWLNLASEPFAGCATTVLKLRISTAAGVTPPPALYLNSWFDGNRDGDWEDIGACPGGATASEWIVQNIPITPPPPGTSVDLDIPTTRVLNDDSRNRAWVRFTLGDQAAQPGVTHDSPRPNGAFATRMAWGETEDYLWIKPQAAVGPGNPGEALEREAAAASRVWTMHRVDLASHPDAVCNDGSAPTFYTRPGDAANTDKWVVFFKGGGSCYDADTCSERGPMLTSGDYWANQIDLNAAGTLDGGQDGLLSTNPAHNPDFNGWNTLYMAYCSSDSWAGTADTPLQFQQAGVTRTFYFRGHHIVNAILDTATDSAVITSGNTLSTAASILFFGWSAGDVGLHNNIDRLAARFSGADVRAVGDAAVTPYRPPALQPSALAMRIAKFARYQPVYDQSCIDANALNDHECGEPDTLLAGGYISTPMFYRMAQYDYAALNGMGLWPPTDHPVHTAEFARQVRDIMRTPAGAFSPADSQHIGTTNQDFHATHIVTNGVPYSMAAVLGNWYFNRPGPKVVIEQPMIRKRLITSGPLNVGDEFDVQIDVVRNSGAIAASSMPTVGVVDVLPSYLDYVRGVSFTTLGATSPLTAPVFQPGMGGPGGRVAWHGTLADGGTLSARFRVRLAACPADGVVNVARLLVDGRMLWDEGHAAVACAPPPPPVITATKQLVDKQLALSLFPGAAGLMESEGISFFLVSLRGQNLTGRVPARIQDALPRGLLATAVRATDGEARIEADGRVVEWRGLLSAADPEVKLLIRTRAHLPDVCRHEYHNVARWGVRWHDGRLITGSTNAAVWKPLCNDLGDAPDSSNHTALPMTAYPGVPASFPTVFDAPAGAPRGPKHLLPMPVHLGQRVSFEHEADTGPDQDPVNNLQPAANIANRDRADDGIAAPPAFTNCAANSFPVQVAVMPGLGVSLPVTVYLNAWLDSNGDGDWEDSANCNGAPAREHIIIDQPVNLAALGAGLHVVAANAPLVRAPNGPAWLRLTLSDRPSNKTLPAGCAGAACVYGDGRGHSLPFALGETEDYRLPAPAGGPDGLDRAQLAPDFETGISMRRSDDGSYVIRANLQAQDIVYFASGFATIGVSDNLRIVGASCSGDIACGPSLAPHAADYSLIGFASGDQSTLVARAFAQPGTLSGEVITASIRASVTGFPASNADVDTTSRVYVSDRPARLQSPREGTSNATAQILSGRAREGKTVTVLNQAGGAPQTLGSTTANAFNRWELAANLSQGVNRLIPRIDAVALGRGDAALDADDVVRVTVDTSLPYDPVSLSAKDAGDGDHELTGGVLDESGWTITSLPSRTLDVRLSLVAGTRGVIYYDGAAIAMSELVAGVHAAQVPVGTAGGGIVICAERANDYLRCMSGQVIVNTPGLVYDITQGELAPIGQATVTLEVLNGGVFETWVPAAGHARNPQQTGPAGRYLLVPPAGIYRLVVEKPGYQTHTSVPIAADGGSISARIGLTPLPLQRTQAREHAMTLDAAGASPAVLRIRPGDSVRFVAAAPAQMMGEGVDTGAMEAGDTHVRTFATAGQVTLNDTLNPGQPALIIVDGAPRKALLPLIAR